MIIFNPRIHELLMVGDIVVLHPSAYAYSSASSYGLGYNNPKDPLIGGSQAYRLPQVPYLVVELRQGLAALITDSGIAWVASASVQEVL